MIADKEAKLYEIRASHGRHAIRKCHICDLLEVGAGLLERAQAAEADHAGTMAAKVGLEGLLAEATKKISDLMAANAGLRAALGRLSDEATAALGG